MDNKLNYSSIENYSATYTRKVVSNFFNVEESINGKQILALTNLPQINLLVIKNLFQKWKKETGKLQSPYFDYDDEEVKQALQHFMNILSNNISIKKSNFEPLLKKSVSDAIFLIFSPYVFYSKEINHPDRTRISIDDLKDIAKYIKINKTLLDRLIARFQEEDINEVFNDEGFSIFNEIYEETDLPKISWDEYLEKFSAVHPLSLDVIFEDAQDDSHDEDFETPLEKDTEKTVPLKGKPVSVPPQVKNLNERFQKPQKTLHEQLVSQPASTLADIHQRNKIDSLKKHITLNQKFMFINELFSGNQEEYNLALERLEQCNSYEQAMRLLKSNYISKNNWDMEGEEVTEFLEILTKKY